jgi:hypothetical protein
VKPNQKKMLARIRSNITKHGHHVYVIQGGPSPRFAYTIGLSEKLGFELVLAGASFYEDEEEIAGIVNCCVMVANKCKPGNALTLKGFGRFTCGEVHQSWATQLLLGAMDYYGTRSINAIQIIPEGKRWTIDVPDLAQRWHSRRSPWKWLREPWNYPVPDSAVAITNLAALRGEQVTEACRWEEDEWELFAGAGPDVRKSDIRMVPLSILLGFDRTLDAVTRLAVTEGCWRNAETPKWQPWRPGDRT